MPGAGVVFEFLNGWVEPEGNGSLTLTEHERLTLAEHDRLVLDE